MANVMNKKRTILIIAAVAVIAVCGTWIYLAKAPATEPTPNITDQKPPDEVNVTINNADLPTAPETEITVDESGKKTENEVQENAPMGAKPPAPKETPKAQGDYTNPDSPPKYTEQETVKEPKKEPAKPKATPKPDTPKQSGGSNEKVYVEGFGYVESGGENKGTVMDSDGDIDKMVGTMD